MVTWSHSGSPWGHPRISPGNPGLPQGDLRSSFGNLGLPRITSGSTRLTLGSPHGHPGWVTQSHRGVTRSHPKATPGHKGHQGTLNFLQAPSLCFLSQIMSDLDQTVRIGPLATTNIIFDVQFYPIL